MGCSKNRKEIGMGECENGGRVVRDELEGKPRAEFCSHTDLLSSPAL